MFRMGTKIKTVGRAKPWSLGTSSCTITRFFIPLENVAEIAQPLLEGDAAEAQRRGKRAALALSPDDFAQKIKSVVRAKSTRATNN